MRVLRIQDFAMQPENSLPHLDHPLRVVYLTAGAAGMICGSCLNDNTVARALIRLGHDVELVPFYTPLRTDEENVSDPQVFFGGINVYLQQKAAIFRWLPRWLDRWLDNPRLIQWASGRSVKIDPREVADLAVSILRGSEGFQRKEVERLVAWLAGGRQPDVLVLSNILTAGFVPDLRRRLQVPIVVTLQGDDIFLRGLPPKHQEQALALIRQLAGSIDLFMVHSRFYAESMADYLGIDQRKIRVVPLGIDTFDFETVSLPTLDTSEQPTIGYLARLAPEKGLHILAEAFERLRAMPGTSQVRLRIAGWLGENHRAYAENVFQSLRARGHGDAFEFVGEVDRQGKLDFLRSLAVLAVPTTYEDPKGLFALEAMAAGVPVVLPEHGAFPELLAETSGGLLHRPNDADHVAQVLNQVLMNPNMHHDLAATGRQNVLLRRTAQTMAHRTIQVLYEALTGQTKGC
jgi:glycosyltransferase involved in cell wall biosynthesis